MWISWQTASFGYALLFLAGLLLNSTIYKLSDQSAAEIGKSISRAVEESLRGGVIEMENGKLTLKSHAVVEKENVVRTQNHHETASENNRVATKTFNRGYNSGY